MQLAHPILMGMLLLVVGESLWAEDGVDLLVLGTAQDGGYPQAGCRKACCQFAGEAKGRTRFPTSWAVVDNRSKQRWLFECTPRFPEQLQMLNRLVAPPAGELSGILLTHGHIGHYAGLMHLGREVIGARNMPVYVMPRMRTFLESNGP